MSSKKPVIPHKIETTALSSASGGGVQSMLMCMVVIHDKQGNMNDGPGVALISNFHKKKASSSDLFM